MAGVVAGALIGLVVVWVLGVMALQLPGHTQLREAMQRSLVLQRLNSIVPPRTVLNTLGRIDPFPRFAGPPVPTQPPDPGVLRQPGVRGAAPSVVRVLGTACGLGVEGSGWVARPGLVVTAAHVVAGEDDTTVTTLSGETPPRRDGRLRLAQRRCGLARVRAHRPTAAARGSGREHVGRDRRLPGERAARRRSGPHRLDEHGHQRRRLRRRACFPHGHEPERPGTARKFGRSCGERCGRGRDDGLRGPPERRGRLRRPGVDRPRARSPAARGSVSTGRCA